MTKEEFKEQAGRLFASQADAAEAMGLTLDQVKKMASGATGIEGDRLALVKRVFAARAEWLAMEPAQIVLIDVDKLDGDPDNFRTSMDPVKLKELAASIAEHGVQQNLKVYEAEPGLEGRRFMVVIGNRRLMASRLAVTALEKSDPALVAERRRVPCYIMRTAEEIGRAKEIQLIENLQREDISPVDEARGFAWLEREKGLTPDVIAARIGVSRKLVTNRVLMLRAPQSMLDALIAEKIGTRHCEIVARIPGEDDRKRAAAMCLKPRTLDRPLTTDELIELVMSEFMVKLGGSGIDLEDGSLHENGPCSSCKWRSGNMEDLAEELEAGGGNHRKKTGISPNVCTMPACLREKVRNHWERVRGEAGAKGAAILEDDEAARIFSGPGGSIAYDSEYVALADKPGPRDVGHFDEGRVPTWAQALKAAGVEAEAVLAIHPETGKVVELVKREEAVDGIKSARPKAPTGTAGMFDGATGELSKKQAAQKAEREEKRRKLENSLANAAKLALWIGKADREETIGIVTGLVRVVCEGNEDAEFVLGKMLDVGTSKTMERADLIEDAIHSRDRSTAEVVGFLAVAILASGVRWKGIEDRHFVEMANLARVELQPLGE